MALLSGLFGPGHAEVWRQLAAEAGGSFVDGGWFSSNQVRARHGDWEIVLDSVMQHKVVYTRLRAPFFNRDGFRFRIYRKSIFTGVGKMLGLVQDVEVGDPSFDDEFVVQGNHPDKVIGMLQSPWLRQLIAGQPAISFEVKDDEGFFGAPFPEGWDELYFQAAGRITDLEQLKKLYELFAEVLDYLCETGSGYEGNSGVKVG
jgi:hypothetical protein